MTRRRLRLYAAHPMTSYRTERERVALAALRRHYPGWRIVDPSTRYVDSAAWLADWRQLVEDLDAVVVFGAGRRNIVGPGVMVEVADAARLGVRLGLLDREATCGTRWASASWRPSCVCRGRRHGHWGRSWGAATHRRSACSRCRINGEIGAAENWKRIIHKRRRLQ